MRILTVRIANWQKHQPRKDIKHPSWFALSNRIFEDPKLFDLTDAEWKALLYIFCQASQQASEIVKLNLLHASRVCAIKEIIMISAIRKLTDVGVTCAYADDTYAALDTTIQDNTEQNTTKHDTAKKPVRTDPQKANAFVRAYCDRFKIRWGEHPQILGKDAGIAKRLAKDLGQSRFEYLLDAFFEMPDAWLVKVKHPLAAFETKLNEVVVFADSGQFTTHQQARQADQTASNALLLQKVREGKL